MSFSELTVPIPDPDPYLNSIFVHGLHPYTFRKYLQMHDIAAVLFYKPGDKLNSKIVPQFTEASKLALRRHSAFGAVDCNQHWTLCASEDIESTPVYKFYSKGHYLSRVDVTDTSVHDCKSIIYFVENNPKYVAQQRCMPYPPATPDAEPSPVVVQPHSVRLSTAASPGVVQQQPDRLNRTSESITSQGESRRLPRPSGKQSLVASKQESTDSTRPVNPKKEDDIKESIRQLFVFQQPTLRADVENDKRKARSLSHIAEEDKSNSPRANLPSTPSSTWSDFTCFTHEDTCMQSATLSPQRWLNFKEKLRKRYPTPPHIAESHETRLSLNSSAPPVPPRAPPAPIREQIISPGSPKPPIPPREPLPKPRPTQFQLKEARKRRK